MKLTSIFFSVSLGLILAGSARAAPFECKKPVDPKRAVIFIDANFGLSEMRTAAKAACDRGESFVRIPERFPGEEEAHRELERLNYAQNRMESIETQAEKIRCDLTGGSVESTPAEEEGSFGSMGGASTECKTLIATFNKFAEEVDRLTISTEAFIKTIKAANSGAKPNESVVYLMVQKGIKAVAERGIRPTALVISGHSSGISIGGRYGWMMLTTLQQQITEAYKNSKELLSDFRSLYLWGCNTLNPYAPEKWTGTFPTIDLIAGFEGSAPSNFKANSWMILSDTLLRESQILAQSASFKSSDEVVSTFSGISGVPETVAAFYLHDRAGDRKWIYERILDTNASGRMYWNIKATELLSAKDCAPVADQIKTDQAYIDSILAGVTPISEQTAGGPLREAYTRSRRNDICRAALGFPHSADRVGLLLFWHGVKRNALRSLETETIYRELKVPTSSVLAAQFSAVLEKPEAVLAQVAAANEVDSKTLASRRKDLETSREKFGASRDYWADRLSAAIGAQSLLPWTKDRQRELRRLIRQERRLKRKSKRHPDLKTALEAVHAQVAQYVEAKRSGKSGLETSIENYRTSFVSWEKHVANVEEALAKVCDDPVTTDGVALLNDLQTFASNLKPKTVSEIGPMSYAEAREAHLVRRAALERFEKATSASPTLKKQYTPLVDAAKWWQTRFEQTVIMPRSECMDFLPWHEYLERASSDDYARFQCHYTL